MLSATAAMSAPASAEGLESKETAIKRASSMGEMDGENEQLERMPKKVCVRGGQGHDEQTPAKVMEPKAACHPHPSGEQQAKASGDTTADVNSDVKAEQVKTEANAPHMAAEEQATTDEAAPLKTESSVVASEHNGNLGPQEGLNIEVRWDIVDEATGNVTPTWFAGCLVRSLGESDSEGRARWQLLYEEQGGFDESTRTVAFTEAGEMWDEEDSEYLDWHREGEEEYDATAVVTADDILREQDVLDREEGQSAHDASLAAFSQLPIERQTALAVQYRAFADKLKGELGMLMQTKGSDTVVTREDVEGILQKLQTR